MKVWTHSQTQSKTQSSSLQSSTLNVISPIPKVCLSSICMTCRSRYFVLFLFKACLWFLTQVRNLYSHYFNELNWMTQIGPMLQLQAVRCIVPNSWERVWWWGDGRDNVCLAMLLTNCIVTHSLSILNGSSSVAARLCYRSKGLNTETKYQLAAMHRTKWNVSTEYPCLPASQTNEELWGEENWSKANLSFFSSSSCREWGGSGDEKEIPQGLVPWLPWQWPEELPGAIETQAKCRYVSPVESHT